MRFVLEDIEIELQPEADFVSYKQGIKSEEICNGKSIINTSEKIIDVNILRKENQLPKIQIRTKEHNIVLDNLLKKQEDLTLKLATLTDEIVIGVDKKGTIEYIDNHHIILQKWESLQKGLRELYEGNIIDRYFLGIEKKINNELKLLHDFRQPRLFGLLFDGLFGSYSESKKAISNRKMIIDNAIDHIPIVIDETIYCDQVDTSLGIVTLRVNGKLNTEETYINKIENHFIRKGFSKTSKFELSAYNGIFQFNINTGFITNSSMTIETIFGKEYHKKDQLEITSISA